MEKVQEIKRIIPKEHLNDILLNKPELCEVSITEKRIRIKKYFTKLNDISMEVGALFLKYIGAVYYGYFTIVLQQTMQLDNSIDLNVLKEQGVSQSMIDCRVRPILRDYGIIIRHSNKRYVNPDIAIRGQTINPTLKAIFPKDLIKHIKETSILYAKKADEAKQKKKRI